MLSKYLLSEYLNHHLQVRKLQLREVKQLAWGATAWISTPGKFHKLWLGVPNPTGLGIQVAYEIELTKCSTTVTKPWVEWQWNSRPRRLSVFLLPASCYNSRVEWICRGVSIRRQWCFFNTTFILSCMPSGTCCGSLLPQEPSLVPIILHLFTDESMCKACQQSTVQRIWLCLRLCTTTHITYLLPNACSHQACPQMSFLPFQFEHGFCWVPEALPDHPSTSQRHPRPAPWSPVFVQCISRWCS